MISFPGFLKLLPHVNSCFKRNKNSATNLSNWVLVYIISKSIAPMSQLAEMYKETNEK
jgi:hypothetical protein